MARFHNKYGNKKIEYEGMRFDSKRELNRWLELKMLEKAGKIHDLQRQYRFALIPTQREVTTEYYTKGEHKGELKQGKLLERECSYIADFVYFENGRMVVEDAKGFQTEVYKIKRKLMLYKYGIRIKEV